jgi:hypothetical protein
LDRRWRRHRLGHGDGMDLRRARGRETERNDGNTEALFRCRSQIAGRSDNSARWLGLDVTHSLPWLHAPDRAATSLLASPGP